MIDNKNIKIKIPINDKFIIGLEVSYCFQVQYLKKKKKK